MKNIEISAKKCSKILNYIYNNLDKFDENIKNEIISLIEYDDLEDKLEKKKLSYYNKFGDIKETNFLELYQYYHEYKNYYNIDIDFNDNETLKHIYYLFYDGDYDLDKRSRLPHDLFSQLLYQFEKKYNPYNIKLKSIKFNDIKEKNIDMFYIYNICLKIFKSEIEFKYLFHRDDFLDKIFKEIMDLYNLMKLNFDSSNIDIDNIIKQILNNNIKHLN